MKAEQLQLIAETAERYADYVVQGCEEIYAARTAAFADVAAMQTPITAEELEAAGWEQASGDDMVYLLRVGWLTIEVEFNIAGEATVTIDLRISDKIGVLFRGVRTMHDIGELVRLLGGRS